MFAVFLFVHALIPFSHVDLGMDDLCKKKYKISSRSTPILFTELKFVNLGIEYTFLIRNIDSRFVLWGSGYTTGYKIFNKELRSMTNRSTIEHWNCEKNSNCQLQIWSAFQRQSLTYYLSTARPSLFRFLSFLLVKGSSFIWTWQQQWQNLQHIAVSAWTTKYIYLFYWFILQTK